jgi:ketosteroid isomerase-like protein
MMAPQGPAGLSGEAVAVADRVEQLRAAMLHPTRDALDDLACEQLSYGHSSGVVEDKNAFMDALLSKRSDFISISLSEQTVSVSADAAVVRHTLAGATNDGGKPGNVNLKILLVWQKRDGRWQLLARQAVRYTP